MIGTWIISASLLFLATQLGFAEAKRAREWGIPFEGTPGELNAITDVAGVEVGHSTIIRGSGRLKIGRDQYLSLIHISEPTRPY